MALDPIQVRNFREKAAAAGYSQSEIDKFVEQKMNEQYAVQAVQKGFTTPEKAIGDVGYGIVPQMGEVTPKREPLSGEQARILGYSSSGLRAIENIRDILDTSPEPGLENRGKLATKALPFGIGARDLRAEYDNLTEAIGRLHSQGAISKPEQAKFERMLPSVLDDPITAENKLNSLKQEIETTISFMGINPEEVLGGTPGATPTDTAGAGLSAATGLPPNVASSIQNIEDFLPESPSDLSTSGIADEVLQQTEEQKRLEAMTPGQQAVEQYGGWIPPTFALVAGLAGTAVGTPVVGAASTAAGYGAGLAVQRSLETLVGIQDMSQEELAKESVVEPVVAGITDYVGGKIFSVAGKALSKTKLLQRMGEWTSLRAIRPSKSQMAAFKEATGLELKDFVMSKGIFRSGIDEIDNLIVPLQKQFDDIIANSGRTVDPMEVYKLFQAKIDELMGSTSPTVRKMADQLNEAMINFIEKYGDETAISLADLTDERKLIDKLITKHQWKLDPDVAGMNTQLRRIYQQAIQDAVPDIRTAAGLNLRDLGIELSQMYNFRDIVGVQQYLGQGTLPVGLLKTIGFGSLGASLGAGYGAASGEDAGGVVRSAIVGLGIPWLANRPEVISFLSKNLVRVGATLNKLPADEKVSVLSEVFRRLLTNLGAISILHMGETGYEKREQPLPAPSNQGLPEIRM